jgi:hypothetical protein
MKAILSMALVLGVCGLAGAADDKVVDPVGTWKCEYEVGRGRAVLRAPTADGRGGPMSRPFFAPEMRGTRCARRSD